MPVEEFYAAVWHRLDLIEETFALARRLRDQGYGIHLGTNQERHRAAYMRTTLGYDDFFDVSCYSCDLKVAKPDPRFFTEAARWIGSEPGSILFVDDSLANVEGAREAGMPAIHWCFTQGHDTLVSQLAVYEVRP